MRRFRVLFVLVATALLVPTALLVDRALRSVEIERGARLESVAERVFDEMERSLSGFLATEEQRPFGQYSHDYTPPGEAPGELVRSPLAEPPALPFVIGYFQIDPDGSLEYPLRSAGAAVAEIERTVGSYRRSGASTDKLRAALNAQAPGSTLEIAQADADRPAPQQEMKKERKSDYGVSAYDALRSLNKGIEQRADRQSKISREYASKAMEESSPSKNGKSGRLAAPPLGAVTDLRDESRAGARANEADRFELSPMVGRLVAENRLMLFRTVVHEQQGYRQGALIDVAALGEWLRRQALGESELSPHATVSFVTQGDAVPASEPGYQHRFAEPFEALSARLVLVSLPGVGGAGSVYALGIVSLVVVMLGLAALYRMVSVVVGYAEQRGNFVAAVTHELKTPLTAIRMYGEMLRDGIVPSEAKRDEYHRHITAESERLTRLVNNVLELSRLEKNSRGKRLDRGDLGAIAREAAVLLRPHVEGAGFTLHLDVEDALPPARIERDAVLQMVFNLVDNAVKYASNGSAAKDIVLACRRTGHDVVLAVRDQGPGVDPRHLRKIFEPFFRGENELTRRTKGTGLGLALVCGLADEMGAKASGRNHPDGGFEVEVVFPCAA